MGGKEPHNADEDVSAFFRALPALVLAHPPLDNLQPPASQKRVTRACTGQAQEINWPRI